jgi:diguanylate cyclase (GGDEF)-like protein
MSSPDQNRPRTPGRNPRRRDWYVLEERHAMMLRGRVVAIAAITGLAVLLPRDATPREHLLAAAACVLALLAHLVLWLAPARRPALLLAAVDTALVVDAGLIFALAHLSGGVDGIGLWLLPLLALAVTLGHSTGSGVKALILGGIVMGALYASAGPGAPPIEEAAGPIVLATAVVVVAAVFNEINQRDLQRRLDRLDSKWAASAALTTATDSPEALAAAQRGFARLLPGWAVTVGLGGDVDRERSWRDGGRVILEVPLPAADEDGPRSVGRLTASRPLPRSGRATVRGNAMAAVREVAADAGAALARIEVVERLEQLSLSDALTGLGNRRAFDQALLAEIERGARAGMPLGLVMLDVDHFKRFNDRHGHQAGDDALIAVAGALRGAARAGDHACRVGGEEFALLLPGADAAAAAIVAERVRASVAASPTAAGAVTVSVGVASGAPGTAGAELVRAADARLYAAKEAGRDRVVSAAP